MTYVTVHVLLLHAISTKISAGDRESVGAESNRDSLRTSRDCPVSKCSVGKQAPC